LNSNWVRDLSVPMHLGLKTAPLCPTLWCQIMAALALHSSPRLPPRLRILTQSGPKKRAQINSTSDVPFPQPPFICLSKFPQNEPPPGSPTGALMERVLPVSRALLNISFMVATKGALPPCSPHKAPTERYAVSRALFHSSFKVPGIWTPSRFPSWAPMERDARLQSLLLHTFMSPTKGALPPCSPHKAPTERDAPFPEPSFINLSKSLVNVPPARVPVGSQRGP